MCLWLGLSCHLRQAQLGKPRRAQLVGQAAAEQAVCEQAGVLHAVAGAARGTHSWSQQGEQLHRHTAAHFLQQPDQHPDVPQGSP